MALAMREFWKRAVSAGLITRERAQQLHDDFRRSPAAANAQAADALPLARWLVAQGVLDRDQARALLAGHAATSPPREPPRAGGASSDDTESAAAWQPPDHVPTVRKRGRGPQVGMVAGIAVGLAMVVVTLAVVLLNWNPSAEVAQDGAASLAVPDAPRDADEIMQAPAANGDAVAEAGPHNTRSTAQVVTLVDDDGHTLWTSPTAERPLVLDALPSGVQVLLVVRLAALVELDEGRRVLEALGPEAQAVLGEAERTLGLARADIERLWIALVPDDSGAPRATLVAESRQPLAPEEMLNKWGQPRAVEHAGKVYFVGGDRAYYLPATDENRVLVVAPVELVKELIERSGPPILRRGFENLLRQSDEARHLTLVFSPAYLATDGQSLLAGDLTRLHEPLSQFIDARTEAVMASAHLGDALFLELRTASPVEVKPEQTSAQLAAALARAAENLERQVAAAQPAAYGRLVVNRFPRMVQLLADYARTGAEDRQAVLRAYLPLAAAHNLVLATQLWLTEPPTTGVPVASVPQPATGTAAALKRSVSLSFPRDTLEHSLELLAKEIDTEIVILGSDLQLEGITKNQSFGLALRDQPAGEILREILRLANPDGKLVYVIRPHGQGEAVYITTRAAAAKRGEALPAELAVPEK